MSLTIGQLINKVVKKKIKSVLNRQAQRSGCPSKNSVRLHEETTCLDATVRTEDPRQYYSVYIEVRTKGIPRMETKGTL